MKTTQQFAFSALLAGLACLPSACSSTQGSVQPENLGEVATSLCVEGAQVDFLKALEGDFDVIYQVYNQANSTGDEFQGSVTYKWDSKSHVLVGTHDSMWNTTPFQSAVLLAYDMQDETYCMGWAKADGQVVMPMLPMTDSGVPGEMVVQRTDDNQVSRTVIHMETANMHTIRRFVKNQQGVESLVLEMICSRM